MAILVLETDNVAVSTKVPTSAAKRRRTHLKRGYHGRAATNHDAGTSLRPAHLLPVLEVTDGLFYASASFCLPYKDAKVA